MSNSYRSYKSNMVPKKSEINGTSDELVSEKGIKDYVDDNTGNGGLLYPVASGIIVTGNMYGLELSMDSDSPSDTVGVSAGMCYDSTNSAMMTLSSSTTVSITTTTDTIYHIFLCSDGTDTEAHYDTSEDGDNLTSWTYKRWLGFVRTNSSGDICNFTMSGNYIAYGIMSQNIISDGIATTFTAYDVSSLVPVNRISRIRYGAQVIGGATGVGEHIWSSLDGTNVEVYIAKTATSAVADTSYNAWGTSGSQQGDMLPYTPNRKFQCTSTSSYVKLLLRAIELKR